MGTDYQSKKNIIIKIIYIISFLVLALGLFLLLTNIKNISCSFLVNKDYVSDKVKNMRRNYAILGYSFNSELWKGIYQKHAHSGNIAFAGIILSVASIVSLVLCFSLSMKNKVINESKKQTEILKRLTDNNA
ncbi:MAG: hypothetical protein K2N34_15275, partial [Lachnospiraceae bacterium]|nr:hypothetical protein [Lachnospiraceae bacterium]